HLFSPDRVLYNVHLKNGAVQQFTLGHLITGAMIEGLIDHATSIAIARDSASTPVKPGGVCSEDLFEAARRIYLEQQELSHDWELQEFLSGREQDVQGVTRA
ncbi:MAG: hypothetical protein WCV86_05585, partial [Patescibacteria group bacterium]